jgi:hypothetical protein
MRMISDADDRQRAATADLRARIRAMAGRWQYSADELDYALADAKVKPEAWRDIVEVDEQRHVVEKRMGIAPISRRAA